MEDCCSTLPLSKAGQLAQQLQGRPMTWFVWKLSPMSHGWLAVKVLYVNIQTGDDILSYPNDPQQLTGCQYDSLQLQVALTPK